MKHQILIMESKFTTAKNNFLSEIRAGVHEYLKKSSMDNKYCLKMPYFLEIFMDGLNVEKNNNFIKLLEPNVHNLYNELHLKFKEKEFFVISQDFDIERSEIFKKSLFASVIDIDTENYRDIRISGITKLGKALDIDLKEFQFPSLLKAVEFLVSDAPDTKKVDISEYIRHPKNFDRIFDEGNEDKVIALIEALETEMSQDRSPFFSLPIRLFCEIENEQRWLPTGETYEKYLAHLMANPDYLEQISYDFTDQDLLISNYEKTLLADLKARTAKSLMEGIMGSEVPVFNSRRKQV